MKNAANVIGWGAEALLARNARGVKALRPVLADNADPMASNATLRHEEWRRIDERVNRVARERLTVLDDLRSRGLVEPVSIGTLIRTTERLEDFDAADLYFDGNVRPSKDKPSFLSQNSAIPMIGKGFSVGFRQLAASRERGEPLDTTGAELASRKVQDKIQALIANGLSAGGPTGGGIWGLTTATNRLTVDLDNNWDSASGTPAADVEEMLAEAYAYNLFGPFGLYVPKNYWATVQEDYETSGGAVINRTVMQRILDFADIQFVRPLDALSDDNVVMVQMTKDVIDFSEAQSITTIQWESNPLNTEFLVMAIGGPHIKNIETEDGDTVNGIVHLRAA
jgi:hypothetical protein